MSETRTVRVSGGYAERQIHECGVCHSKDIWGDSWNYYGSVLDVDYGNPVLKVCSDACRKEVKIHGPEYFGYVALKYRCEGGRIGVRTPRKRKREYVADFQI